MAFVCTISDGDFSGSVFKKGFSHAAVYPIGYDDIDDKSYSLFVSLDPLVGDDSIVELSFRVIEYDGETDSEYVFWSGRDTAGFIKGDSRKAVLTLLAVAVGHLLNSAKPAKVLVCSMDKDAPEIADRKFIILGHVFENNGYSVKVADSYHGMRCWSMELQSHLPI